MTLLEYKSLYINKLMELSGLELEEAETCFKAIDDMDNRLLEATPEEDAECEVSYWDEE